MDFYEQDFNRRRTEFFADAVGLIEATDAEYHFLWNQWHYDERGPKISWESRSEGFFDHVGKLGEHPVCVTFRSAKIKGQKVIFYNACSRVVDHDMVRVYLEKYMPKSANRCDGYLNNTDANNPYIVFHSIKETENV